MANDLGTISILVDSSQVRSATQDIKDLGNSSNSATKSASVLMQAFAKAAAQSARDAQYLRDVARANQEIINTNLKVSNSYNSAEQSAIAFTKELRNQELQAQKTARANQDAINKQLGVNKPSAVSSGAGFGAIESEILRLESMYNKVAVAARVYEQAQQSLNKAVMMGVLTSDQKEAKLLELTMAYQKVGSSADKAQVFINRFGENAQVSGRGLNRFGMIAQQVGYQVGDFFVQVQSGTNVLVAFGQQATQLAGLIPGVLGAALGIGISLVTALGAAWMRTSGDLGASEEAVKGLTDKIKSLNEETANIKGIQTLPDEVVSQLSRQEDIMLEMLALQDQLAEKERVVNAFREAGITKGIAYQAALAEVLATEGQIADLEKERAASGELLLQYQEALTSKRKAQADQEAIALSQELALLQEKIKYGEDSVQVKALENQQTVENYAEELRRLGLHQSIIDTLVAQKEEVIAAGTELENASLAAEILERALQAAASAMAQLSGFSAGIDVKIAQAAAKVDALKTGANAANAALVAGLRAEAEQRRQTAASVAVGAEQLREINRVYEESVAGIATLEGLNEQAAALEESTKKGAGGTDKLKKSLEEAEKAAEQLKTQLEAPLVNAVGSISDAFGDFVARGLKDFKGFVQSILGSFQNMIAQMIAMAVKNRIMLSLGIGGITPTMAAAGQVAGLGSAGGMLGSLGAGAGFAGIAGGTGLLGGLGNAISMPLFGGGGAGLFSVGANAAAAAAGGGSAIMASIGAAIPALAAVAAVFSFFTKKTTELDSGLRITVKNMDALVKSFQKIQTKKFWGLSTSTSTTVETVSTEVSDPIVQAVQDIQTQVIKAAKMFDVSSSAFKNFVYKMEISLKGLTEEEKIQKVNEEIMKMGDAFTTLSGKFTSMNELLAAAQERYDLTTRLLALQGKGERLLARQRKLELAAVNDLNKALLLQIYALEDVQIAAQKTADATSNLRAAMDRQLADAAGAVGTARDALEKAINKRINSIRTKMEKVVSSLEKGLDVASRKADASRKIFEILDSALKDRSLVTPGKEFASRNAALSYVSGGGTDADKLTSALDTLNQPSQQLFGSFQDYARDFAKTTNAIKESRDLAEATMTADERMVSLLEKQIEDARAQAEARIQEFESLLAVDEEVLTVQQALSEYLAAQATYEQVQQQHEELVAQFPMLNESILSVAQAIKLLKKAIREQTAATQAADEATATTSTSSRAARVPAFANGGLHSGGIRLVGEKGPEIENTGPSRIFSSNQTAGMFRDPDLKDAVRSLKEEVSGLRSEQRQIQMDISKYTKRSYDIERKWDVEGLPATRT